MTWIFLVIIASLVLFNVPVTRPHAQRIWNAVWTWIKDIKFWKMAVAILAIAVIFPNSVQWAKGQAAGIWTQWNGTATPAPKATPVDSQKVYEAAKSGAHEGATKAVEAATPKIAEAAKGGANEGATKAVESKPTPSTAPTPAPASSSAQQPTQPAPQAPAVGPSGYTDGQLAVIGKLDAEKAAEKAEAAAAKAKAEAEAAAKAKAEAEAAKKAAEAAADKADDAADRSATNADVAKKAADSKITEIAASLGKISIDRSVSGALRLSVVSSSVSSTYPSGRRVWIEQERTANVTDNILLVGKVGNAFSARDFQVGITGITGRYRIWIEDPSGGFRAPNGTLVSVSDWASISK